jgi:hypothetical protein
MTMRFPRRYLLYAVILAPLLVGTSAVLFWIQFKPPPTHVDISGSSQEMGQRYGQQLRWRMRLLTRVYLDRMVCHNNAGLIAARQAAALKSLAHWPSPYAEELHAIARASRIKPGALAYGNAFLDLGNVQAGCRSAVIVSTNLLLHGHNLDWDSLGGLGRWTTCLIRREPSDGRFATIAVGFPGMVGAPDIINEYGLALSFNELGTGRVPVTEPVFVMMRRIAETCATTAHSLSFPDLP